MRLPVYRADSKASEVNAVFSYATKRHALLIPLFLAAMEAEAAPLIEHLGLTKDDPQPIAPPAPCKSYSGEKFGMTVHIVINGEALTRGQSQYHPSHLSGVPPRLGFAVQLIARLLTATQRKCFVIAGPRPLALAGTHTHCSMKQVAAMKSTQ